MTPSIVFFTFYLYFDVILHFTFSVNADLIVHVGCPKSVISYWQEAGRCARDGRQGFSYILFDNFTASLKTTEKTMAHIVKNPENTCIRQQVMNVFAVCDDDTLNNTSRCEGCTDTPCSCPACKCCSVCCKKCPCSEKRAMDVATFLSI